MAIIGTLPDNIQNGQSVDANPVMADFNFIVNQVNANATPLGTLTAPSGTRTIFHQASAPLGWTQDTSITDHTIQLIGSAGGVVGGAIGYSTMFNAPWTSDGHALTVAELASHAHVDTGHAHSVVDGGHIHSGASTGTNFLAIGGANVINFGGASLAIQQATATGAALTGISIATGSANIANTGSGSAHTHTKTFNAKFVQMIMAVKA